MALPNTFAAQTAPTMPELDQNFAALGALTAIPCTVAGTNTITMTPAANTPTIAAYANYQPFSGVAAATNTGAVTAAVGGLTALAVYKDTAAGPVALAGGEIAIGNALYLVYDSALTSGNGGFHLLGSLARANTGAAPATVTSVPGTTLTAAVLTGSGTAQAVVIRAGAAVGDFNDTTDTAANIIAAIPGAGLNTYFRFTVQNATPHIQTILAGAGVTVTGVATTANATTHAFVGVVTNIGTPAVTIFG